MKKTTLFEDVNRQRSLMGLPLITEGMEMEEGWMGNVAAGIGLTLLSLLPGVMKAQSLTPSPEAREAAQATSEKAIDSNRLNMILKTLKSQGWIVESNVNDIFKYIDKLPQGEWMIVDYATPVFEQTKRGIYQVLNSLDAGKQGGGNINYQGREQRGYSANEETPKFVVYKHTPAPTSPAKYPNINREKWEGIGFILMNRSNTYQASPEEFQQEKPTGEPEAAL